MRPKYEHMRKWEEELMQRYHTQYPRRGTWTYDVHLKVRETPVPSYLSDNEAHLWQKLTAKRVDAVLEQENAIYVIEVKDRLRPSAIGQALTYKILYTEQYAPTKQVQPVVLCEYVDYDMEHVASVLDIEVWRVK